MSNSLAPSLPRTLLALAAALLLPSPLRAADHGDAPKVSQDLGADIADEYVFLDPNDNTRVIVIGTVHGFITAGEAPNFAAFDSNVKFRFEVYNKHTNRPLPNPPANPASPTPAEKAARDAYLFSVAPNRYIDVAFSKRVVPPNPNDAKFQLAKPGPQTAAISLLGFPGMQGQKTFSKTSTNGDILTTPVTLAAAASPQTINNIRIDANPAHDIKFFAGETDDPFFFDLVGFSRLVKSIHDNAPDFTTLQRARDTFAGYNVLAIAFSIPKALLVDTTQPNAGKILGFDFVTLRHATEVTGADGVTGSGGYKPVDRVGNPAINVALIPFNKKNNYNASSARLDASGKFAPDILASISQLGLGTSNANIAALASIAVARGDLLQLDTNIANGGPGGGDNANAKYPNGRRLKDDVIDIILSVLANGPVSDGVNANDVTLQDTFPFLALPQQPRATGVQDDGTRN